METKSVFTIGISKKTGKPYVRVDIQLTDTYTKTIFLNPAEEEILRRYRPNMFNK